MVLPVDFFSRPLLLGSLTLRNRILLAPLAGVSDVPFRRICQWQGAGLTYVEMLSATAIRYRNKRTFEMMARHAEEGVLGVQVTGPSAAEVGEAVATLSAQGFETIDINMGCPVRKVVGAGCGSAILKDQERLRETVAAARSATRLPLSIKYRLGYTREDVNVAATTRNGVLGRVDMVTIHGRTRSESYDTPVDLGGIRAGVEAGRGCVPGTPESNVTNTTGAKGGEGVEAETPWRAIPIVGNGDVFCHESARAMVESTGCDAVMISRGALGNPWVFAEILAGTPLRPTLEEWLDLVLTHIDFHEAHYGATRQGAVLMRKHLLWYAKGFPGAKGLRDGFNVIEDLGLARTILKQYAATLPRDLRRFECSVRMTEAGGAKIANAESAGTESAPETGYDPKWEMDREYDRGVGHLGLES